MTIFLCLLGAFALLLAYSAWQLGPKVKVEFIEDLTNSIDEFFEKGGSTMTFAASNGGLEFGPAFIEKTGLQKYTPNLKYGYVTFVWRDGKRFWFNYMTSVKAQEAILRFFATLEKHLLKEQRDEAA